MFHSLEPIQQVSNVLNKLKRKQDKDDPRNKYTAKEILKGSIFKQLNVTRPYLQRSPKTVTNFKKSGGKSFLYTKSLGEKDYSRRLK